MNSITLKVNLRKETKKKVKELRQQGTIPGVLYGHKIKSRNVSIKYSEFEKVYNTAGESSLVDLVIEEEKPVKVLIQEVQLDPVKSNYIHADFHQVRMDEKITTTIPVEFIGESSAVKEHGGMLVTSLDEIEIECLPGDLIHEIEVDITQLKTFDDIIYIKDLKIPETIKALQSEDEAIVSVIPPRTEEELKELDKAPEEVADAEAEIKAEGEEEEAEGEEQKDSSEEKK